MRDEAIAETPFTERQTEVLTLVARRLTIKEIAAELEVSESAINQRIRAMKERAGVNTHRELSEIYLASNADSPQLSPNLPNQTCSDTACRIPQLDAPRIPTNTGTRDKPPSAFSFQDSQTFRLETPWKGIDEARVVPRVLDGPNAVWFRIAAIVLITIAILVAIVLVLASLQAISDTVGSRRAVPDRQLTGLLDERSGLGSNRNDIS